MNAFCLPGGKVGVYTGMLPVARDDAGLAAVLGHEVAHDIARAGYHPQAARSRPLEFLSTHPAPATRVAQIEAWIPEAMRHYQPASAAPLGGRFHQPP